MSCDYCKREVPTEQHKLDCPYKSTAEETTITILQNFANSSRGKLLLGQALAYALHTMEQVKPSTRDVNNIRDMKALGNLFEPYFSLYVERAKGKSVTIL